MYKVKAYGVQRENIDELYKVLETGVENSYLVFNSLLVDVGVPYKKVEPHIKDIEAILLTHRHTDHLVPSTLGRILRMRPSVMIYAGTWMVPILQKLEEEDKIPKGRYKVIHPGYQYTIGQYDILPFSALHDVPNLGYFIYDKDSELMVFHVTDISSFEGLSAMSADIVAVEFNHDATMMDELIMEGMKREGFSHYAYSRHNHGSFQKGREFVDTKTKGEKHITLFKLHTSSFFLKYLDDA